MSRKQTCSDSRVTVSSYVDFFTPSLIVLNRQKKTPSTVDLTQKVSTKAKHSSRTNANTNSTTAKSQPALENRNPQHAMPKPSVNDVSRGSKPVPRPLRVINRPDEVRDRSMRRMGAIGRAKRMMGMRSGCRICLCLSTEPSLFGE
jgi:hypothetical protein